ncbi:MAG: triose-phosphate isomerase [Planctomycetota bacterium]|nr:triose-phosphate isomerase [Planctomycetota bacterium]
MNTSDRKPLIAGNWKLNLSSKKACELARAIADGSAESQCDIALFPTYLAATAVAEELKGSHVRVGVQDVYDAEWGAYTGEISPAACLAEGIGWAIVGHSERRHIIGEQEELLVKKARAALEAGMTVIYCVGETETEREQGRTFEVLSCQVRDGVLKAAPDIPADIIVAYEPVWAIGTGKTATPEIAQQAHEHIRGLVSKHVSQQKAELLRILYGGSAKPANIAGLMEKKDIDGGLVGGASLDAESFLEIIRYSRSDL